MSKRPRCPSCDWTTLTYLTSDNTMRTPIGGKVTYSAEYSRCTKCGEEFYTVEQGRKACAAALAAMGHGPYTIGTRIVSGRSVHEPLFPGDDAAQERELSPKRRIRYDQA
jgi:protein-arginine kinase activator protein McsA